MEETTIKRAIMNDFQMYEAGRKEFEAKERSKNVKTKPDVYALYKPSDRQTISVEIKQQDGMVILTFSSDGGKFGADETIAGYRLNPARLFQILQNRDDYTDDEL